MNILEILYEIEKGFLWFWRSPKIWFCFGVFVGLLIFIKL